MSFLSIAFLTALPLAAVPILLHLFDRRRNVVIEWGAMQFLMEAATRRTNARRLKQWLLLLLRVLAIAALVMALARPMLPGNWFGNSDRGETIFVVDNSMSMMRTVENVSLLETAIERTVASLDDIPPGDSVRILLASPYPIWAMGGSMRIDSNSRQLIADQLRELRPTNGRSDLLSALLTAAQTEVEPTQQRRRIVLLTDGQGSDWSLTDESGWKRLRKTLNSAVVPTELDIVELEENPRGGSNLAVNKIQSSRTVVGVNQSFTLVAQVQNHGRSPSIATSVTWSIGGEKANTSQVTGLEEGEVRDVAWSYSLSRTGVYALSCAVDVDDELTPDNRATVVVQVVDEVPVLLVEDAADLAEIQQDAFFVQAALGWIDGEPLDERGVFAPQVVDSQRLERMNLQGFRAVVIPNLTDLSDDVISKLHEFVSNGGGLWIALGPRSNVEAFNEHFFADGEGLAPLAVDRIVDEVASQLDANTQKTTIDPSITKHPATLELADSERLDTSDISVSRRFRFVPPPQSEDVSVLLGLSNGEPLAVENHVGRGRVIVQSIPLRLQWSELAKSQAFVVMVQDWFAYLTQPQATRHNLSPGDPISLYVANAENREATLRTPHGDEVELTADTAGDGVIFRSSRTILPGDYLLELGLAGDQIPFHVNRDPLESNLTPLTSSDHKLLADLSGLRNSITGSTSTGMNHADPLWPLILMVLICLIAAELLLSGLISRERFGSDPISESTEHWAEQQFGMPVTLGMQPVSLEQKRHKVTIDQEQQTEKVGTVP